MCSVRRKTVRSMRDASEKRTTARVASPKTSTSSPFAPGSTRPSASTPTTRPAAVKTIAAVIGEPSMRREIAANPRRISASVTSCQCIRAASQRSATNVLEADRAAQAVERALERLVERGGTTDAILEMKCLHDQGTLAALRLQIRASDDAVAPEEG